MGQRRHFYVSDSDAAFIDSLPADITVASILRRALSSMRAEQESCSHVSVRCSTCGAELGELAALEGRARC